MASYLIRIELHGADSDDYDTLHDALSNLGIYRIVIATDGTSYWLPTGTYSCDTTKDRAGVLASAKSAAGKTLKKFSIVVAESKGMTWTGLES